MFNSIGACISQIWAEGNRLAETPLAKAIGAGLIAYFVYRLGLRAYRRQKEAEYLRARLVEQGIDVFAASIDHFLSVTRHNWQIMLRYLKLYRDAEETVEPEEFFRSLLEVDSSKMQLVSARRVADLLGEELLWIGFQKVYSFACTRTDFIVGDFGSALKTAITVTRGPIESRRDFDKQGFVERAAEEALSLDKAATEFYVFASKVSELASLADRHVHDRRSANKFRRRDDVQKVVADIRTRFGIWDVRSEEIEGDSAAASPQV